MGRSVELHSRCSELQKYRQVWTPARPEDIVSWRPVAPHTRSRPPSLQTAMVCWEVGGHRRRWRVDVPRHRGVCRHCP